MQTLYFDLRDTKGQKKEIEDKILAAAHMLQEGGIVALPTETVYGLGANGMNRRAVSRIFEVKGRPQDNPLILHIPGQQWLPRYCKNIPPMAYVLARKFWPGPLTMILQARDEIPRETTAGLRTVAIRCPNHPATLAIIREAGIPIAAPSANLSGQPSITSARDVLKDMDGKIEAVVDGGPCSVGVESTILDLTCNPPRLLRPGGLPLEDLEQLIGHIDVDESVNHPMDARGRPRAPGMKYRHYAPRAPITVVNGSPAASAELIRQRAQPGDGVICFEEYVGRFGSQIVEALGPSEDKVMQAQRLFEALRAFDYTGVKHIYAQCPDNRGLGYAISNRLKKAAGFEIIESDQHRIVLGITGGSGAGKSTVLAIIKELGGTVIDCDQVYHKMLNENEELRRTIGIHFPGILNSDGFLDRRKLGREVFAKKDRMDRLNAIVFQFMVPEVKKLLRPGENGLFAVDAINLVESGLNRFCDRAIAVTAPLELRVLRIMKRDHIDEKYARMRITAQKPDEYYRGHCDIILNNAAETPEIFHEEATLYFTKLIHQIKEEKSHGKG